MTEAKQKSNIHQQVRNGFDRFIIPKINNLMNNEQKPKELEMKEIHFWELPDTVRLRMNIDFLPNLFSPFDAERTAKRLGISKSYLNHLRNGRHATKPSQLLTLTKLFGRDTLEVQKQITSLNSTRGGEVRCNLPIKANEEISSLIGHYYGDGSIMAKKPQFKFCNFNKKSLNEVKTLVANQFKSNAINETETTVTYSSIVGEILCLFGAQRGTKLKLQSDVPEWIRTGNHKVKSRFIRALFDDDGSVSSSGNNKNINFHQIVLEEHASYSRRFLKSVVKILEEFGVTTHEPYLSRKYQINKKERHVNFLIISDWESLKIFESTIGFFHSKKKKKITEVLSRKKALGKYERNLLYKKIIHLFHIEENPLSTAFISEKLSISTRAALKRLKNLQSDNKVAFEGRIKNRSFLWKLNGGENK